MAEVSKPTDKLNARDDLVTGDALATPRLRAEARLVELLVPAAQAMRRFLEVDPGTLNNTAQSAGFKAQADLAMKIMDGCLSIAASAGQGGTRKAAQILAAVGGEAVNKELMRRYAQKLRTPTERQRIVEAVPAVSDASPAQPTAAAADGGDTNAADGGSDAESSGDARG